MTTPDRISQVRAGNRRAMSALMRDLDDDRPGARAEARALGQDPQPFIVGVTGAPGAGKSTLVDALIGQWRARGKRVGVVAIDPSSPLHGGAVLGDRVRMQQHATDEGVFIRSLASRGAVGGLSRSTMEIANVLGAGGFSLVLVETVGVGQAEVEIAAAADVTVLVTVPGLGDDVQTLKSGILESADILVVNKADHPGAAQAAQDLHAMLDLRHATVADIPDVPILQTVATSGAGIAALVAAIDEAHASLAKARTTRRHRRAEARIRWIVLARTEAAVVEALRPGGVAAGLADEVAAGGLDPEAAADALMTRLRKPY